MNFLSQHNHCFRSIPVLLLLLLSGCQQEYSTLEQAKKHIRSEHWQLALNASEKGLQENPNSSEFYFLQGRANLGLQQEFLAINDFTRAIELKPRYCEAFLFRSIAYEKLNKHELAKQDQHFYRIYNPDIVARHSEANYLDASSEQKTTKISPSTRDDDLTVHSTTPASSAPSLELNQQDDHKKSNPYAIKSSTTDKNKSGLSSTNNLLPGIDLPKWDNPLSSFSLPGMNKNQSDSTVLDQLLSTKKTNKPLPVAAPLHKNKINTHAKHRRRSSTRRSNQKTLYRGLTSNRQPGNKNRQQSPGQTQAKRPRYLVQGWSSPAMQRSRNKSNAQNPLTGHARPGYNLNPYRSPTANPTNGQTKRNSSGITQPLSILPSLRSQNQPPANPLVPQR